jgi:hypothetical protein
MYIIYINNMCVCVSAYKFIYVCGMCACICVCMNVFMIIMHYLSVCIYISNVCAYLCLCMY